MGWKFQMWLRMTELTSCGTSKFRPMVMVMKMVMANQPNIVVDKQEKAEVLDIGILSYSNIRKKERDKFEKYQGKMEELGGKECGE